jgi:hypothetical protein
MQGENPVTPRRKSSHAKKVMGRHCAFPFGFPAPGEELLGVRALGSERFGGVRKMQARSRQNIRNF